ncbi:MAG TPA: hypothetical protein VMU17_04045 [Elusimicrobiota bacterium]|nr:hypothetical protein [Elusimicrobiota bacterium]
MPRDEKPFMIGATQIENEERARITIRSIVELANSAYAIHPAFAEAEIVEMGSGAASPEVMRSIVPKKHSNSSLHALGVGADDNAIKGDDHGRIRFASCSAFTRRARRPLDSLRAGKG